MQSNIGQHSRHVLHTTQGRQQPAGIPLRLGRASLPAALAHLHYELELDAPRNLAHPLRRPPATSAAAPQGALHHAGSAPRTLRAAGGGNRRRSVRGGGGQSNDQYRQSGALAVQVLLTVDQSVYRQRQAPQAAGQGSCRCGAARPPPCTHLSHTSRRRVRAVQEKRGRRAPGADAQPG